MDKRTPPNHFQEQIQPIREAIDAIDAQILSLLVRRKDEVEKIFSLKKECGMPVFHPEREAEIISTLRSLALKFHLDPDFIEELYRLVLHNSRADQSHQAKIQKDLPIKP